MRALILDAPGSLRLAEMPTPTLAEGDLLVRVESATTCGTDLKAFRRGHPQIPMPGPFGHEYSGRIAAVGAGSQFEVGDEVMGVHSAPCQECFWCKNGQENLCESVMGTKVLGTYAEFVRIPARIAKVNVFPKPETLSWNEASLLEPLACVAQGVHALNPKPGERVLVLGPGAIGLMFVAALRAGGVEDVTLAGRNQARLEIGESLGARPALIEGFERDGRGFDAVIECTGVPQIWEKSIDFSRRGGRVMLFGGCPSGTRVSWDAGRLHYDQIILLSPFHFGLEAVRTAYGWLSDWGNLLRPLVSGERALEDADEVFHALERGEGVKYAFKP